MNSNRTYERNRCFYLWIYRDSGEKPELLPLPKDRLMKLPVSGKEYKVTLKNVKTYIKELMEQNKNITKVEVERATFVCSLEKD